MNRKLRPTKSAQQIKDEQIKDEQIGLMLEEIQKDIENFKIIISEKDKQLYDLKNILKSAKNSYQQVTKENKQLEQYIKTIKQQEQQRQQQQQQLKNNNNNNSNLILF